jgi:hypothetical protein
MPTRQKSGVDWGRPGRVGTAEVSAVRLLKFRGAAFAHPYALGLGV